MRTIKILIVAGMIISATSASGQFLGQMSPAGVLQANTGKVDAYAVTAEDGFAVVGSVRYGLAQYFEGRARLGFIDPDGPNTDLQVLFGGDIKYQLWKYKEQNNPCDLSLGADVEYTKLDPGNILCFGGSVIGSMPYRFKNGTSIEPYARINLRLQRNSINGHSDSDFKVGSSIGTVLSIARLTDVTAEIQFDEEMAFMFGANLFTF